jgi:flagella basal body P-ring formation protein FlgA
MLLTTLVLAVAAAVAGSPVWNPAAVPATDPGRDAAVRAAIERGVAERMGAEARVTVDKLEVRAPATIWNPGADPAANALRVVLPPGVRTGRLLSMPLFAGAARLGTATALVRVRVPHVRAARSVARDTVLTALDTTDLVADLEGALFERLPAASDLVGARARRDVAAGEALTHAMVETAFAVRSGDTVEMVARLGLVEARGVGKASGSGYVGDRVRVSRVGQPGLAAARIVAPGVVQLIETFAQMPAARRRRAEEGR